MGGKKNTKSNKVAKSNKNKVAKKGKKGYGFLKYPCPFPATKNCKLEYVGWVYDAFAGDGTNVGTTYQFKLNSCHDPYKGVTGSYNIQGYFYDQLSMYKRYCVNSCKVEIQFATPATKYAMVLLRPTTVATEPTDFQLEESRPFASKRMMSTGGEPKKLTFFYSMPKVHGVTYTKLTTDDLYSSAYGTDPTLLTYLNVMLYNADGTTTSNPLPFNIKITQYVKFYDRTVMSAST